MKISAYYIAEELRLKPLKEAYAGTLLQENPYELFYRVEENHYLYVFDYGTVVFAGMPVVDVSRNIALLQDYAVNPLPEKIHDDITLNLNPDGILAFRFDTIEVPRLDENVVKIAMLSVAQSVAIDFYSQRARNMLGEINILTNQMEADGTIRIGRRNMLRFIGRTLNSKNKIVENLFIFDSPDITWEDELLDRLHRGLSKHFELQPRFREIEYTFKIIEDNLTVFRELYLHRESNILEYIIIALICIEVIDLLVGRIF